MTRPDVVLLLDAARTDPSARGALADAIQDADGETPASKEVLNLYWNCEKCDCPQTEDWVCWDDDGHWHYLTEAMSSNPEHYNHFFHKREAVESAVEAPKLELVRTDRWHLLCPFCATRARRSSAAKKANATRKANRAARTYPGPHLFENCE